MPDTIQNDSTLQQSSQGPNGVRPTNAVRPAGLPILSTAQLTTAEREKLIDLQRRYRGAIQTIEDCLECGRVDRALDGLQILERDIGTLPVEIARSLGSNR